MLIYTSALTTVKSLKLLQQKCQSCGQHLWRPGIDASLLRWRKVELKFASDSDRRWLEDDLLLVRKRCFCHCWINQSTIKVALTCWEMSAFSVKTAEHSLSGRSPLLDALSSRKRVCEVNASQMTPLRNTNRQHRTNPKRLFIDNMW